MMAYLKTRIQHRCCRGAAQVLLLLIFQGASLLAQTPPAPATTGKCEQIAEAASSYALANGAPHAKADHIYQTEMLRCAGVGYSAYAAYAGAMRIELARLARLFLAHKIDYDTYVSEVQDRRSKLRSAEHDHAWVVAYQKSGDDDADFVPNSIDRCPNSPPDSLTDNAGCPAKKVKQPSWIANRERPSAETIDRIVASLGYMATPGCSDARIPESSEPVHQGFDTLLPGGIYAVVVTRVLNQPIQCPIFYQVEFRYSDTSSPDQLLQVAFRDNENADTTSQATRRRVFLIRPNGSGLKAQIFNGAAGHLTVSWRVRAINGNGMTSGWSHPLKETIEFAYHP